MVPFLVVTGGAVSAPSISVKASHRIGQRLAPGATATSEARLKLLSPKCWKADAMLQQESGERFPRDSALTMSWSRRRRPRDRLIRAAPRLDLLDGVAEWLPASSNSDAPSRPIEQAGRKSVAPSTLRLGEQDNGHQVAIRRSL